MKKQVQNKKNDYADDSEIFLEEGGMKFRVMPTSISGFSAVIYNADVSIALKRSLKKLNSSPVIKVEFRSEFLARVGYIRCLELVNNFVSKVFLDDYIIKISEIHLATDIQGYNFCPLDYYRVKTRSRTSEMFEEVTEHAKGSLYGTATSFSGFTFGGGNYRLRVYDKTLEINKYKNKAFAKTHYWENSPDYKDGLNVWRIEMQYRREKLKTFQSSDLDILDGYSSVLNSIPDIWSRALSDFVVKDISDIDCFNILRRKRTLKDGSEKPLTKNAIYQIFKRSEPLEAWQTIATWNTYESKPLYKTFKAPFAHKQYVFNSIKSLFSTMSRAYGSFSTDTFIKAFKDAELDSRDKKNIGLVESAVLKQLDYFNKIDYMKNNGVVSVPDYDDLKRSVFTTLEKSLNDNMYFQFNEDTFDKILSSGVYDEVSLCSETF
jgi:hypothetical protein